MHTKTTFLLLLVVLLCIPVAKAQEDSSSARVKFHLLDGPLGDVRDIYVYNDNYGTAMQLQDFGPGQFSHWYDFDAPSNWVIFLTPANLPDLYTLAGPVPLHLEAGHDYVVIFALARATDARKTFIYDLTTQDAQATDTASPFYVANLIDKLEGEVVTAFVDNEEVTTVAMSELGSVMVPYGPHATRLEVDTTNPVLAMYSDYLGQSHYAALDIWYGSQYQHHSQQFNHWMDWWVDADAITYLEDLTSLGIEGVSYATFLQAAETTELAATIRDLDANAIIIVPDDTAFATAAEKAGTTVEALLADREALRLLLEDHLIVLRDGERAPRSPSDPRRPQDFEFTTVSGKPITLRYSSLRPGSIDGTRAHSTVDTFSGQLWLFPEVLALEAD
jgi:hypothetical protein